MPSNKFSNKRITCPECGKKAFAPFLNSPGGYCHFCGNTFTDGQYPKNQEVHYQYNHEPQVNKEEHSDLFTSLPAFRHSNFAKYFVPIFGEKFQSHCDFKFLLCSDIYSNLVIPFYNYYGQHSTNKTIPYSCNGHRNKQYGAFYGFHYVDSNNDIKKYSTTKANGFKTCLYNELALNPKYSDFFSLKESAPVIIVESEKSVVIASFFLPEYIWLASGGVSGITDEKVEHLFDRQVLIAFDNEDHAQEKACAIAGKLKDLGINAASYNIFNDFEGVPENYDIADGIEFIVKNNLIRRNK